MRLIFLSLAILLFSNGNSQIQQLKNPAGLSSFSHGVCVLKNGNYVIAEPEYSENGKSKIGVVFLMDGKTHKPISKLTGSRDNDKVGIGVTALANGNFIVRSLEWDNGHIRDAGAFTWVHGDTGLNGVVGVHNSMVGDRQLDRVGANVVPLSNGNYVVNNAFWHPWIFDSTNITSWYRGAVTFMKGDRPTSGVVSELNSLTGRVIPGPYPEVGDEVKPLKNGNYVILSSGSEEAHGAITWGSGDTGVRGIISRANSLFGDRKNSRFGLTFFALSNGNFITGSPWWSESGGSPDQGVVTFCYGDRPTTGEISLSNSLFGPGSGSEIGLWFQELPNGKVAMGSPKWRPLNAAGSNFGAITILPIDRPVAGWLDSNNSLVGTTSGDRVGESIEDPKLILADTGTAIVRLPYHSDGKNKSAGAIYFLKLKPLTKGRITPKNALVGSHTGDNLGLSVPIFSKTGNILFSAGGWDNGDSVNAGAVIFMNPKSPKTGYIDSSNAVIGKGNKESIGSFIRVLKNGDFVVCSPGYKYGGKGVGAITYMDGNIGLTGYLDTTNSIVGDKEGSAIGWGGVWPLADGNYVISSPLWFDGNVKNIGAVTWFDASKRITGRGKINRSNSIVGTQELDRVGSGLLPLKNGNYVILSSFWNYGNVKMAGAATLIRKKGPVSGVVTPENSVHGIHDTDRVGKEAVEMPNSNYVLRNIQDKDDKGRRVGSFTWCDSSGKIFGGVTPGNSLFGLSQDDFVFSYGPEIKDSAILFQDFKYIDGNKEKDVGYLGFWSNQIGFRGYISECNNGLFGKTKWNYPSFSFNTAYRYGISTVPGDSFYYILKPLAGSKISVTGNGQPIYNGAKTVYLKNNTFGGSLNRCNPMSDTLYFTYKIHNEGTGKIRFAKNAPVQVLSNQADFSVVSPLKQDSITTDSVFFTIMFAPKSDGLRQTDILILNDECGQDSFIFRISAVVGSSEINVHSNLKNIPTGSSSISSTNNTDFGDIRKSIEFRDYFTENLGKLPLIIDTVLITGPDSLNFVVTQKSKYLLEGESKRLRIQYAATGVYSQKEAWVNIYSTDCDEAVYRFKIGAKEFPEAGVQNINSSDLFKIYPLPNNGSFSVVSNYDLPYVIEIYSADGRLIMEQESDGKGVKSYNMGNLSKGLYFGRIKSNQDIIQTFKLIIN